MRQSKIKRVVVHTDGIDRAALAERVSTFHVDIIERYLKDTSLTNPQKIEVIDKILERLRVYEAASGAPPV